MSELILDGESLTLRDLWSFLHGGRKVAPAKDALWRVQESATYCSEMARDDNAHYGINTGFGVLANKRISKNSLATLQRNLLRSHATGMGEDLPRDIVRLMMLLRVNSLLRGYSGVSTTLINHLITFINKDVIPVVPAYGSVGASGDLAPLAHMALPLIGEGAACVAGEKMDGLRALEQVGLSPLELKPKEGLALINGTQLMSAFAVRELDRARRSLKYAIVAGSMSVEAYQATDRVFDPRLHALKGHPGQIAVASAFRSMLEASEIVKSHRDCDRVQDPYSFRCIPQVLGAVLDTFYWVEEWVTREVNAVTDNPIVFREDDEILSGGNFHGEHMAFALDGMGIAVSEIGSIAERRIDKLLDNDTAKLPQCLIDDPGLNSGLMVSQYLAASLVSENKVYAHPASVDSVPTSASFEDHVSMGSIAAFKLEKINTNVQRILAVEMLCAAQAMDYVRPPAGGVGTEAAYKAIREHIPFIKVDTPLSGYLATLEQVISQDALLERIESTLGSRLLD